MGLYGVAEYGVDTYGEAPKFAFSALPFTAEALDYDTVDVRWTQIEGDYNQIRLTRSQDGYPETQEDGLVLWEWYQSGNEERITEFIDSPENSEIPLVPGRFAYYRIWVFQTIQLRWVIAGDAIVLVPRQHSSLAPDGTILVNSTEKIADLLPRMYFSTDQSPHDAFDKNTTAYKFIDGFAFTLDEIMTFADNLLPEQSGQYANPALLELKTRNFGLDFESYIGTKNQKKLVRNAAYFYQNKGTIKGLSAYTESLTGFAPVITTSPNVLLSTADSTFYKSTGFWEPVGNTTLSVQETLVPPTLSEEPNAIDQKYTAQLIAYDSTGGGIRGGDSSPKKRGNPVEDGAEYTFSVWTYLEAETPSAVLGIRWYDGTGSLISVSSSNPQSMTSDTWVQLSHTSYAPGGSATVLTYDIVSNVCTLELYENLPTVSAGDEVLITNVNSQVNGTHTVDSISLNTTTGFYELVFTLSNSPALTASGDSSAGGKARPNVSPAAYAVLDFALTGEGTVSLDMVQLAKSDVTDFYEARAIDIQLLPKKTNYLLNPSFEVGSGEPWVINATADSLVDTDLDLVTSGDSMLRIQANPSSTTTIYADTNVIPQNSFYSFSIYGRMGGVSVTATQLTSNVATLTLEFAVPWQVGDVVTVEGVGSAYDGDYEITSVSGTQITYDRIHPDQSLNNSPTGTVCRPETMNLKIEALDVTDDSVVYESTGENFTLLENWNRYEINLYVGKHENDLKIRATVTGTTNGCVMLFDAAQVEQSFKATDYFDGSFPEFYGTSWTGTANESSSIIYPNKTPKLLRLAETARNYLPFNLPYTVSSLSGREFANIE